MKRRRPRFSSNALTKRWCRENGYDVDDVQLWKGVVRHDLFNLLDCVALPDHVDVILGIQATTKEKKLHHIKEMKANKILPKLLKRGMRVELWSWEKIDTGYRGHVTSFSIYCGHVDASDQLDQLYLKK